MRQSTVAFEDGGGAHSMLHRQRHLLVIDDIVKHELAVFVKEGRFESQHLVQQHTEAPPVYGSAILLPFQQLWCDVLRGATEGAQLAQRTRKVR